MTVYVDAAMIPARVGNVTGKWSHLTADAIEELHEFADRIGLRRSWIQTCKRPCSASGDMCPHWHYDVTASKRAEALRLGAEPIDMRQLGEIISARRREMRQAKTHVNNPDNPIPFANRHPSNTVACPRCGHERMHHRDYARRRGSTPAGVMCTMCPGHLCQRAGEGAV